MLCFNFNNLWEIHRKLGVKKILGHGTVLGLRVNSNSEMLPKQNWSNIWYAYK